MARTVAHAKSASKPAPKPAKAPAKAISRPTQGVDLGQRFKAALRVKKYDFAGGDIRKAAHVVRFNF
jgi:hypothetical protein